VTLTFDLLTRKSLIPRKVYLGEKGLKSMSGKDFANARQINRHTEGRTDGRRVS